MNEQEALNKLSETAQMTLVSEELIMSIKVLNLKLVRYENPVEFVISGDIENVYPRATN